MKHLAKEKAFQWLWGTAAINLGFGAIIWSVNTFSLYVDENRGDPVKIDSLAWQSIGASLWGFGVAILMVAFATSAIVDAILTNTGLQSGGKKPEAKSSGTLKETKNWLKE